MSGWQGSVQATEDLVNSFPEHLTAATSSLTVGVGLHAPETRPYEDNEHGPPFIASGNELYDHDRGQANVQEEGDTDDMYGIMSPYFEYRNLVGSISEKLRKENALRLAYVYDLPNWYCEVGPTHDPTSALRILIALESKGVFAPNNLTGLTKALETIEREDLAQRVREFRK